MRIAYQGEPGAYSEAAALRFSPHAQTIPCESFDQVFAEVQSGKATHGILPIENSIGGSIHRNYDLLLEHELPVVAEVLLQVSHNLLAFPGPTMADLRKAYSHPQRRESGAIASAGAAEVFDLSILESGIQDYEENITRFILISKSSSDPEK